jgi:hypothetical protein
MLFGTEENKAKRVMPGMSTWVNLLDYSAAVLPVTTADKNIDIADTEYQPMNAQDDKVHQACTYSSLFSLSLSLSPFLFLFQPTGYNHQR